MTLDQIIHDESIRQAMFPCVKHQVCFAHAGVSPLSQAAVDAMQHWSQRAGEVGQWNDDTLGLMKQGRAAAAQLTNASPAEIALLGPTSLGLSLIANGIDWREGDQVIYYPDDYPANVYNWAALTQRGVTPVPIITEQPGVITWDILEPLITERTRLVALATCNYLSGYAINYNTIGARLHERGVLLCLDAIQTLGALPMDVEHVDFLSADSHKWMLGPCGAGIVYIARQHWETLRPTLLGAENIHSPNFIAQTDRQFVHGARRYEPGMLNLPGIAGMTASIEMLNQLGIEAIHARIAELRQYALAQLTQHGWRSCIDEADDALRGGILSVTRDDVDLADMEQTLRNAGIVALLRHDRAGTAYIRIAPHFYNSFDELDRAIVLMAGD